MTVEESSEAFLARQSIVNRQGHCVAHELLFRARDRDATAVITDDFGCSITVMQNLLGKIGIHNVLGKDDGYLNCNSELLNSDLIDVLPAQQMVLEVLETVDLTEDLAQRCRLLQDRGFRISLDDVRKLTPQVSAFLPYVDVVKIDWPFISVDEAAQIAEAFHKSGKLVLAEKIETREDFTKAQDIGCDLFQGFFFTRPQLVKSSAASVNSATWLNLLDMALHDSSIDELERFLRAAPSLTVQLLRLANSISRWYLHISDLTSIRQGLALIGMERLARWCCFMLYGTHENNKTDPLVQLVRRRADFMERVTRKLFPNNERLRQEAYLSALLSLAHVPNGMDAQSFMSSVAVGPSIREAVLARGGWLGALLTVAECVEKGEYPTQKQLTAVYADGASLLDGLYL